MAIPDLGLGTPYVGLGSQEPGTDTPYLGVAIPDFSLGCPYPGVGSQEPDADTPDLGMGRRYSGLGISR